MEKKHAHKKDRQPAQDYRGVGMNIADDDKVSAKMVRKDVKELNNNPRNTEIDL